MGALSAVNINSSANWTYKELPLYTMKSLSFSLSFTFSLKQYDLSKPKLVYKWLVLTD